MHDGQIVNTENKFGICWDTALPTCMREILNVYAF